MVETLLVTGIHREELGFGDQVAKLLDRDRIHILRIPEGISRARSRTESLFYANAQHREIYLQLHQQVKGHYRLVVDLHCGLNEAGRCADLYCRDERFLHCAAERSKRTATSKRLRLVKILTDSEPSDLSEGYRDADVGARTLIPEQIWNDPSFVYVGLEVYLAKEGVGVAEDWHFANNLIETVRLCAPKEA